MALLWESQEAGIHLYRPGKTKYDLVFKASTHCCLKYCLSKNKIDYSRLLACSNAKSDLPGSLLNGVQPICKSKLHSRGSGSLKFYSFTLSPRLALYSTQMATFEKGI